MESTKNTKVTGGGSKLTLKRPVALTLGLLLLVLGGYSLHRHQTKKKAQFAYQETKRALSLMAIHFNHGLKKIDHLNQFEIAKQKIYRY